MKLRLVVCWLLLVEGGFCDCQEVKGELPVQSSQRITVTVEKQGKPVQGAKVAVSGSSLPQAGITVLTDSAGVAKLPTLETGTYSIQATFEGGIAATALSVKQKTFAKPTQLTFALVHSPSRMDLVAAQSNQVTWQTKVFAGAVKDPSGAPIPSASIQIFKKGELDEWNGTLLYADQNGRFTVPLPDGEYLAFFQSSGFQSRIAAFEIDPQTDQAVVPVILQIAATCAELQDLLNILQLSVNASEVAGNCCCRAPDQPLHCHSCMRRPTVTAMEDTMIVEEIKQLLERLVIPRLDVIAKQLEDLRKQSDSMESGMREFRRSLGWSEPG